MNELEIYRLEPREEARARLEQAHLPKSRSAESLTVSHLQRINLCPIFHNLLRFFTQIFKQCTNLYSHFCLIIYHLLSYFFHDLLPFN